MTWFCGLPYINLFHLLVRNYGIWAVAFTLLAIFSFYRTIPRYIYILIAVENARHLFTQRYGNILDHRIDVVVPFSVSDTGGSKVNPSSPNRSRTYDLFVTSTNALPLSYRRLGGAKATKVCWVHVTNPLGRVFQSGVKITQS